MRMMKKEWKIGLKLAVNEEVELSRREVKWLESFKLRRGSLVSLQDESGKWFRARVVELSDDRLRVKVFEELLKPVESELFLILLQAVPNKERMELIIEKAVELGVDVIQPFFSTRSYRVDDFVQKKWHRWQERARKASEQCRRGIVPQVMELKNFPEAMAIGEKAELRMVLDEAEEEMTIKEFLNRKKEVKSCALVVGPEGGWERQEIEILKQKGFMPVSMGGRILRVETAAIIGVGIIQYVLGG